MAGKLSGSAIQSGTITVTQLSGSFNDTTNAAYAQANSAYGQANAARSDANTTFATVNSTFGTINTNYQAAYAAANNSNLKAGGLVSGTLNVTQDLIVGGNIYLEGNTTFINVATYSVEDSLIYMSSNNKLTDSVDIGIMGGKNTSGTYSHTGLARDATDAKWKLFDGLAEEGHVGNVVDFANTYLATLVANVEANTLTVVNGVTGNVNFDSGTLFVDSVGNKVGIGTTSPGAKVQIDGNSDTSDEDCMLRIVDRDTTSGSQIPAIQFLGGASANQIGLLRVNDQLGFQFRNNANSTIATFNQDGNVGIGTTSPGYKLDVNGSISASGELITQGNDARLSLYRSGGINYFDWSSGQSLHFSTQTSSGGAGRSTKMTLTDGGNVGIGTTSPATTLHVDASGGGIVRVSRLGTGAGIMQMEADGTDGALSTTNNLRFQTASTERARIDSSGRVLIGTAVVSQTSSEKLEVYNGVTLLDVNSDSIASLYVKNRSTTAATIQPYVFYADSSGNRGGIGVKTSDASFHQFGQGGLSFYTGSAGFSGERLTITSGGSVGIGTTDPTSLSSTLQVHGRVNVIANNNYGFSHYNTSAASNQYLISQHKISDDGFLLTVGKNGSVNAPYFALGTVDTERMRITSAGSVGIGTTNPAARLHILAGATEPFRVGSNTAGYNYFTMTHQSSGDLGYIGAGGGSAVSAGANTDFAMRSQQGGLIFATNGNNERVRIDSSGNVGIGTTSPDIFGLGFVRNLGVYTSASSSTAVLNISGAVASRLILGVGTTRYGQIYQDSSNYMEIATTTALPILFKTNNAEHMRIGSAGNIGIGTTSNELAKFQINEGGITAAAISTGWPAYNAETAAQSKYLLDLQAGGNGSVATSGQGPSVTLIMGGYFDSRGIITMRGAGGSSPSDQGTGYGKDLMVKAGNSDNGNGLVGGRLFLAGGSGYSGGAFGTNYGSIIMQSQGGNVCIGTTSIISSYAHLHIRGSQKGVAIQNSDSGYYRAIYVSSTNLYFYNGTNEGYLNDSGAWTNASDVRIKKDITEIKYGLNTVLNAQPRSYRMIDSDKECIGFVAQEMLDVVPEVVSGDLNDPDRKLGLDYGSLVAVAFKAIQELKAELDAAKLRITQLENN